MLAYTRSPAVSIPNNGDHAIEDILARYDVRWKVIFGVPPMWCSAESCNVIKRMLAADGTDLGQFHMERVRVEEQLPAVFRVVERVEARPDPPGGDRPQAKGRGTRATRARRSVSGGPPASDAA